MSHPLHEFVPKSVPKEKVYFLPATTDPLDGLNKSLDGQQFAAYLAIFNRYLLNTGQRPLNPKRESIVQIARFDPSKGIPDVIEAYAQLVAKLTKV